MTGGAQTLSNAGVTLEATAKGISDQTVRASGAAGEPDLAAAAKRLGAALGAAVEDTGAQVRLAAQLASNAAADLMSATGG